VVFGAAHYQPMGLLLEVRQVNNQGPFRYIGIAAVNEMALFGLAV
jgi:hypothetical protein